MATTSRAVPRPSSDLLGARIVLRPVATPLPLGFLALGVATSSFAVLQLGWIPPTDGRTVALGVLALTVPLQLVACVMGFLARDPVAATGMGILSGAWGAVGLATLTNPPGAAIDGLGVILLGAAACLLVPAASARSKLVPASVIALSAVRFGTTGVAHLDGGTGWMSLAGWIGLALAALSFYAALALELEATDGRTVLPLGRRGPSAEAMSEGWEAQTHAAQHEPGVRRQL